MVPAGVDPFESCGKISSILVRFLMDPIIYEYEASYIHVQWILNRLDRLEFDFFIIPMPFYTGCAGVPLDVKVPYSPQYKKAWYDQKY